MNVRELRDALAAMPDTAKVVVVGHYGEIDQELDEVELRSPKISVRSSKRKQCCVLVGLNPSYGEPD